VTGGNVIHLNAVLMQHYSLVESLHRIGISKIQLSSLYAIIENKKERKKQQLQREQRRKGFGQFVIVIAHDLPGYLYNNLF